jgi:hypothetical protein
MMGFMETVHGLPRGPLDLMLHSPGGDANSAEAIMRYLRDEGFGPIRAIVPISAMSAATMMALCCDEILMGRHSQLGPIDPQFTLTTPEGPRFSPAQAILDQFDLAKEQCAQIPQSVAAWLPILRSYAPGLLSQCVSAQKAAEDMVSAAMQQYMLKDDPESATRAAKIAAWFNDHTTHRSHGKPLRFDEVKDHGVSVSLIEDDPELQDSILSAWHSVQLSLSQVSVYKLIENSMGVSWLISGSPGMLMMSPQMAPGTTPGPSTPPRPAVSGPSPNRAARRRQGN